MKIQDKHIEESRVEFKEELDAFSKKLLIKCSIQDVREGNCPWADTIVLMNSVVAISALLVAIQLQDMLEGEA